MLTDNDDLRHVHDPDPRWRESLYWNFLVPDASLGGFFYLRLDPNAALTSVMVAMYRGFAAAPAYFYARGEPLRPDMELDDVAVTGLHIKRLEPLRTFQLTFADGEGTDFRLTFTGIHSAFDYARSAAGCRSTVATNRFEQAGRLEGTLRLAGQTIPVLGFGQRDHSWGVRDWDLIQHYKWFAVQAGERSAVHLLRTIIRGELIDNGYVFDGSGVSDIVHADITTTYGADAIGHRRVAASFVDDLGRTTVLEGSVYARMALPIERSILFEGAGRFVLNGQPGVGVAEYLWPASYVEHVKKSEMGTAGQPQGRST